MATYFGEGSTLLAGGGTTGGQVAQKMVLACSGGVCKEVLASGADPIAVEKCGGKTAGAPCGLALPTLVTTSSPAPSYAQEKEGMKDRSSLLEGLNVAPTSDLMAASAGAIREALVTADPAATKTQVVKPFISIDEDPKMVLACTGKVCEEVFAAKADPLAVEKCVGKQIGDPCKDVIEPPLPETVLACAGKICSEVLKATANQAAVAKCAGKNAGDACEDVITEEKKPCEGGYLLGADKLLPEGGTLWSDELITKAMGFYRNSEHEGHYLHKGGKFYDINEVHTAIKAGTTPTPLAVTAACRKGFGQTTYGGTPWCCPGGAEGETEADPLGEYILPDNVKAFYDAIVQQGTDLLGKQTGFTSGEQETMRGALPSEANALLGDKIKDFLTREYGYTPEEIAQLMATLPTEARDLLMGGARDLAGMTPGYSDEDAAAMKGVYDMDYYNKLMGFGSDVLDRPEGYTDEAISKMFGLNFDKIRGQEGAQKEALREILSRQGQLGTGTELERMGKVGWNTEKEISDLRREIFLANENQKRADLSQKAGISGDLFTRGTGFAESYAGTLKDIGDKPLEDQLRMIAGLMGVSGEARAYGAQEADLLGGIAGKKTSDEAMYSTLANQFFGSQQSYADQVAALENLIRGREVTDTTAYTGMANQLFGSSMDAEKLMELINASRRGEGNDALMALLAYLTSSMGSFN